MIHRILLPLLVLASASHAGNWPEWRGPSAQGHASASGLPETWSETSNVAWKTELPGRGHSTPVMWGDQIWLTTANLRWRSLLMGCLLTSAAFTLARGMLKARASGSDFASPAVLQAYESTHRRATLPLYLATHAVAKLYTSESLPSRVLRDAFLGIGQRLTPFKRLVAASLTGAH